MSYVIKAGASNIRFWELGFVNCPVQSTSPSPPCPLRFTGIFFGFPAIGLNLLTALPFFSALSLLAEGKRGALQVVCLAFWGLFVVYSLPLSWHGVFVCVCRVHMICAPELWLGR